MFTKSAPGNNKVRWVEGYAAELADADEHANNILRRADASADAKGIHKPELIAAHETAYAAGMIMVKLDEILLELRSSKQDD